MTISIIIATYNAQATLQRCLNSIISQKSKNVELLIIDGQSKDKTLEIIRSFGDTIDYCISEKDMGIYDAWNKGIKAAKGKWLMFLGADDILNLNAISTYSGFLEDHDLQEVDYVSAYNMYVDQSGKALKILGGKCGWKDMRKRMCAAHVGSLHSAQLFKEVGMYNLKFKICGDYELLLRKKANLKMQFIEKTIVTMEAGGMSLSFKAIKEIFYIRKLHNALILPLNFVYFLRDALAYYVFRLKHSV